MKRAKVGKRKSRAKIRSAFKTVDEYLDSVTEPARSTLENIRAVIRSVVPPEATETISYGMPAVKYKQVLVWFAAFSNHCSLFPTPSIIEAFKDELRGFSTTKGSIHFPSGEPLPAALVRKMVRARIAQIEVKGR